MVIVRSYTRVADAPRKLQERERKRESVGFVLWKLELIVSYVNTLSELLL